MKKIPLTQGKFAIVDDADYEYLNQWKWMFSGRYAVRWVWFPKEKRKAMIMMHRDILRPSEGMFTDHISGDGLDNRRGNLRECTVTENMRNRTRNKNNSSGAKGVCWDKQTGKWLARIGMAYKSINLGRFSKIEDAKTAYAQGAKYYYGEFAKI